MTLKITAQMNDSLEGVKEPKRSSLASLSLLNPRCAKRESDVNAPVSRGLSIAHLS